MSLVQEFIENKLAERCQAGTLRALKQKSGLVDFCSNDYLGFARSAELKERIDEEIKRTGIFANGSTGSRLLSGNSAYAEDLELEIAGIYQCGAGLIFNSGYDANLGLFSSLPQRGDTIITDELIHASIIDGARLSFANRFTFKHNDLNSLEQKLQQARGNCFIAIESVYSMDGDTPPIPEIAALTEKYHAHLIVDEAHAVGIFGHGLVKADLQNRVFARVITFGKALGCHGAMVLGSSFLKDFLVNFARPFIYSTAPSFHSIAAMKVAFAKMLQSAEEIERLKTNINLFKQKIKITSTYPLIQSNSAIQCIVLKSNEKAKELALGLQDAGMDVRPIFNPTVAQGTERIRICLHSFNTFEQITQLTNMINRFTDAQ